MSYYTITADEIRDLLKVKRCRGIRIIVDEKHTTFKTAKTAQKLLVCIIGKPRIYRNALQELTFNFDEE